jgi:hypothetical protein
MRNPAKPTKAGTGLYAPHAWESELSDFGIHSAFIDMANLPGAVANTVSLYQYPGIKGDWLFVDGATVGACEADLWKRSDDSMTVTLAPGRRFDIPFDQLNVFLSPAQASTFTVLGSGVLANPGISLFYGTGPCPFDSFERVLGSAQPIAYAPGASTDTAALLTTSAVAIPQGANINASITASQLTTVTETSLLRATLTFNMAGGGTLVYAPTFETNVDVATAAVGTSRVWARWQDIRAPLGAVSVFLNVANVGTAATNTITLNNSSLTVA